MRCEVIKVFQRPLSLLLSVVSPNLFNSKVNQIVLNFIENTWLIVFKGNILKSNPLCLLKLSSLSIESLILPLWKLMIFCCINISLQVFYLSCWWTVSDLMSDVWSRINYSPSLPIWHSHKIDDTSYAAKTTPSYPWSFHQICELS